MQVIDVEVNGIVYDVRIDGEDFIGEYHSVFIDGKWVDGELIESFTYEGHPREKFIIDTYYAIIAKI